MFHLYDKLVSLAINFYRIQRKAFVNKNLLQEFSHDIHNKLLKHALKEKKLLQTQVCPPFQATRLVWVFRVLESRNL